MSSSIRIFDNTEHSQMFLLYEKDLQPCTRPYISHAHPEHEIAFFTSGSGYFTVNRNRNISFQPGDIFIFRSNEEHFVTVANPGEVVHTINIHFLPQFLLPYRDNSFDIKYLRAFMNPDIDIRNRLHRGSSYTKALTLLIKQILEENHEQQPDYEQMIKAILLTMLIQINRNFDFSEDDSISELPGDYFNQIGQSLRYINEHLTEKITLDQLASSANMSSSYYSHVFKLLNRIPPMDYIIRKRVELAMAALQNTDDSILDIAFRSGFNNTANFNRAFKKYTGMVPSVFRKQASVTDFSDIL